VIKNSLLARGVFATPVIDITHNPYLYIAAGGLGVKEFCETKNLIFGGVAS
jgi:hypothetical protein